MSVPVLSWLDKFFGGGGGASERTFVFQPGGTAGGNIYTDWATMMGAVAATVGPLTLVFDGSLNSGECDIPSGAWDFGKLCTFQGVLVDATMTYVLALDGATFTHPPIEIRNIDLENSSSAPLCTTMPASSTVILWDSELDGDTHPVFAVAQTQFYVRLHGLSVLTVTGGTHPCITSTGNITLDLWDNSKVQTNALSAAGTISFQMNSDSAGASLTQLGGGSSGYTNIGGGPLDTYGRNSQFATGSLPAGSTVGQRAWDTTRAIPVWWNGTAWVKADGTP